MGSFTSNQKEKRVFKKIYEEGLFVSKKKIEEFWNRLDKNNTGNLNQEETLRFFGFLYDYVKSNKQLSQKLLTTEEPRTDCIHRWKKEFDFDANGLLSYAEFYSALGLLLPGVRKSEDLQITLIGAMECELNCHVLSFINNVYTKPDKPDVFVDYPVRLDSGIACTITPTVGPTWTQGIFNNENGRLRIVDYVGVDMILITFSVISPRTFQIVEKIFLPEIFQHTSGIPLFLIGVHTEFRENPEILKKLEFGNEKPVTKEEGEGLAVQIGALRYFEVSALKMEGLRECFLDSVEIFQRQVKVEGGED